MRKQIASHLKIRFYDWDGVRYVRTVIREYFRELAPKGYALMEVAVNEAVNNALKYGQTAKGVSLVLGVDNGRIVAEVKDFSTGFDYRAHLKHVSRDDFPNTVITEDCGRGIFLMRAAVDRLSYNKQGNRVRMTKKLSVDPERGYL